MDRAETSASLRLAWAGQGSISRFAGRSVRQQQTVRRPGSWHQRAVTSDWVTTVRTLAEILSLPAVTDLVTAGRALGIGRTRAYELARDGSFPCRVIRAGKTWMVPTADLLTLLGLPVPAPAAGSMPGAGPHDAARARDGRRRRE
jgi:hypothetical protein